MDGIVLGEVILMAEPIKVFISYSHQDEVLCRELVSHLSGLQNHRGVIKLWHDRNIDAGTDWDEQIDINLKRAEIILFLVSSPFINSRYCSSVEMKYALEQHRKGTVQVIPVIIRDCDWKSTALSTLQGIPRDNKAVATWGDEYSRDTAWVQVATVIAKEAQTIQKRLVVERQSQEKVAAVLQFQQLAESLFQDGQWSPAAKARLKVWADRLNLQLTETDEIKAAVMAAYQAHQDSLQLYRRSVEAELWHRQSLDAAAMVALQGLREDLEIAEEEARQLEKGVVEAFEQVPVLQTFSFEVVFLDDSKQVSQRETRQARFFSEPLAPGVDLEMVAIPTGSFQMGSPDGDGYDEEHPQHLVTVPSFFLGKYPVTQAEWRAVAQLARVKIDLDPDPSKFTGDRLPVECVSWFEAVEFCERISRETGKTYRLPHEAEWEYACRARTTTAYHFGNVISSDLANYHGRTGQTSLVGQYSIANSFGLYDMHGNVWEWCLDHWHENYTGAPQDGRAWLDDNDNCSYSGRGGSWYGLKRDCRSAYRGRSAPDVHYGDIGFRVALSASRNLM